MSCEYVGNLIELSTYSQLNHQPQVNYGRRQVKTYPAIQTWAGFYQDKLQIEIQVLDLLLRFCKCLDCLLTTNLKSMHYSFFIGIDISKKTLDFAVRDRNGLLFHIKVANSSAGLMQFQQECLVKDIDLSKSLICCEHTGIYSQNILALATESNFSLWLESSLRIKRSLGLQRGKSDKIDSVRISEYAFRYADQATIWQPERQIILKLRQLVALRKSGPHRDYLMPKIPFGFLLMRWLLFRTRSFKKKWKSSIKNPLKL